MKDRRGSAPNSPGASEYTPGDQKKDAGSTAGRGASEFSPGDRSKDSTTGGSSEALIVRLSQRALPIAAAFSFVPGVAQLVIPDCVTAGLLFPFPRSAVGGRVALPCQP
jgi:hypothetical protein